MIKDKEVEKTMLNVKNLTFEVNEEGKKRCLVNHISFQVEDGEMLVITGPNGGGKSTLAKVLAGIEKANSGEIFDRDQNAVPGCRQRTDRGRKLPAAFRSGTMFRRLFEPPAGRHAFRRGDETSGDCHRSCQTPQSKHL